MKLLRFLFLLILTTLSSFAYVLYSSRVYRIGFPLDDAWIHQVYARNFANGYGWSFEPGVLSGGTTAPLWTLLLSVGHWIKVNPLFFSFGIGIVLLASTAFLGSHYLRGINSVGGWLGLYFIFEWHFVWASVSGMETILAIFVVMAILYCSRSNQIWLVSLLLAASVWIRPDLLTLSIPIMAEFLVREAPFSKTNLKKYFPLGLLALSLMIYLVFNQGVSGAWLPTTFYAKQAEYAELRKLPLLNRLWQQFSIPLVGGGALLLPGFVYCGYQSWRDKNWWMWAWFGWLGILIALYATRLPVIYQHGRYILPATVVYALMGLQGSVALYEGLMTKQKIGWILAKSGVWAWICVTLLFWGLGANAYAKDVQVIETQMVEVAKWAQAHLPAHSRVAVHDIGAMGYFTQHQLIDLAGLVNPEVIPIMRDEAELARYLDRQMVDYLICFPSWYPNLVNHLPILHRADEKVVREYNELPMTIYSWRNRQ